MMKQNQYAILAVIQGRLSHQYPWQCILIGSFPPKYRYLDTGFLCERHRIQTKIYSNCIEIKSQTSIFRYSYKNSIWWNHEEISFEIKKA